MTNESHVRRASDDRLGGIALIGGTVLGMITMAFHPTGHDLFRPGEFEHGAFLVRSTHTLAIASAPITFLGALALTWRLASPGRWAVAAVVLQGFGLLAVMIAAAANGFVAPAIAREMLDSADPTNESWNVAVHLNWAINQAFAQVFVAASSAAIALWSVAILRTRALARHVGVYGLVVGPATLLALLSGRVALTSSIHGFGLVVLAQAVWSIWIGALMIRAGSRREGWRHAQPSAVP
jgi:hypothetical protein